MPTSFKLGKGLMFRLVATVLLVCGISLFWAAAFAQSQTHTVQMISEGKDKIFVPDFLIVDVGDTVRFVNVSGHHNTESIKGMIPEGVKRWKSKIDQTFYLKITHEGVYGYKCTPHYNQRMVGLIVAGDPVVNLEAARGAKMPPLVKELMDILFSEADKLTQ